MPEKDDRIWQSWGGGKEGCSVYGTGQGGGPGKEGVFEIFR
jgi:hypothetical protein